MNGFTAGDGMWAWRAQSALEEARGALALGLYARAKRAAARAIALGSRPSSAYALFARACAGDGRWSEADRALAVGWQRADRVEDAFALLRTAGDVYYRRGHFAAAALSWQRALMLCPDWPGGWYRLGCACACAGAFDAAAVAFRECDGADGDCRLLAAWCAHLAGMPRQAKRDLHLAARRGVTDEVMARALGALAFALGQDVLAAAWAKSCAADTRFVPIAFEIWSLLAWRDGRVREAACLAKKAVTAGGRRHAPVFLATEFSRHGAEAHERTDGPSSTMGLEDERTN
ncbi:tetratricopeptide repeat protein [Alicyclobacillus vulcanalis]|uniref:Tetratricopeptide repeat-containing protein n=1 Tax=Alicyclobacillus vulcanalis TaxID=252246 RepID=A0A1N7NEN5_9BACL|nr:hypothetical protein [Alicyclobacillus vulcanalis]SIS96756.1 hypothetical protein SAMN05421799_10864 [Alicyclobacillus vulcanalis]